MRKLFVFVGMLVVASMVLAACHASSFPRTDLHHTDR